MTARQKTAARAESAADIVRMLPQRYVERYPLAKLEDYPGNPKEHDVGLLHESIDASGFYGALLVQEWPKTPRYILAGHGRKDTLQQKGVTHVPVLFVKCDPKTARRIVLVDNRSTERGGFDDARLARLLVEVARSGDNALVGTGYDLDDTTRLLEQLGQPLTLFDAATPLPESFGEPSASETGEIEREKTPQQFICFAREQIIESAFQHYRAHGFPFRAMPLHVQMQELNRLAALDQDAALKSQYGYHVADTYHPHRFKATAQGKLSPFDAFNDDRRLRIALDLQLEHTQLIPDHRVFGALLIVRNTQACANFRPGYAMHLYRRFGKPGGVVLDPCTGYGGRLVGWLASQLGGTYIGVDPNVPTHEGNEKLARVLANADTQRVVLHNAAFEDVADRVNVIGSKRVPVDFAFTSPPYFAKEMYADADTQSWVRYKTIDEWCAGFLTPMLRGCFAALRKGGHCVINIADVTIKDVTYPLERLTLEAAQRVGFTHADTLTFEYAFGSGRVGQGEQAPPIEARVRLPKAGLRDTTRRRPRERAAARGRWSAARQPDIFA